ncbi:glycosyltransferase family 4 protein [Arthrobacter psychrolactophilus]
MKKQTVPTVLVAHPNPELYGADRMLLESVRGLVDAGSRVVVTLPDTGPLVSELQASGAIVEICPTPVLRKSYLTPRGLWKLAGETVKDTYLGVKLLLRISPDVVYVSTITVPLWIILAKLTRHPVVAHVHEAENSAARPVRWALAAPLCLATSILSNSRFSTSVIITAIPKLEERISQIANGVHGPNSVVDARSQIAAPLRLLYVGRLSSRKGVDIAIDTVAELARRGREVHLDVVGAVYPGYEWYEAQLRHTVDEGGLDGNVTFHGFQTDVWPFLAAADIALVLSRIDEPFGNTAVEAILAGRPLVVSDTSGLREAAANYRSVKFVPSDKPTSVADAIDHITERWEEYRTASEISAKVAAERHSPESYRQKICAAVQTIQKPTRS